MKHIYCPACGNKLIPKSAGDDGNVPFCDHCNKYWFDSFACVSIVMVVNEEKEIAMLRQNYLSDTYWTYTAGFIGHVKKADFVLSDEVDQAEWVPYKEAPKRMFPERPGNTQHPIYYQYVAKLEDH